MVLPRMTPSATSSARIDGFSATLSNKTFAAGFEYNPITAAALAVNSGSVLT
jgi:hypothetical protein